MVLPLRTKNPPESFPFATIGLIVANVVVYLATTDHLAEVKDEVLQNWAIKGGDLSPLKMLTAMFLHGGPMHLIGNMWFLALFGFAVEGRLKWFRFLPLYFLAGIAGDLLHHFIFGINQPDRPSLGASGAIMGVVGAALFMFPFAKVTTLWGFGYRWGITDWPLWGAALYFLGIDLLLALIVGAHSGTGHLAHLGGALGGALICACFRPTRDSEMVSESKATLHEVKDLGVLSRMELGELHRTNPSDPVIVLHWMDKSLRDPYGVRDDCRQAFLTALPKMRREVDARSLANPVLALASQGCISSRELVSIAGDLERAADGVNAARMYEVAYGLPDATEAEQETACFRTGLLYENVLHGPERAAACYNEVLQRWPMGPFAPQAKSRLEGLRKRVPV